MAKKYEKKLTPIRNYAELDMAMQSAGSWFIGSFMVEFVDSFDCFSTKEKKNQFIDYFYNEYCNDYETKAQLRNQINIAIRIIESGLVEEAMRYVINTNDLKIGCDESKTNARFMLERLADGSSVLPEFEK